MPFFTYILRCSDGSLYVGYTQDLAARLATHNAGRGASYTCARRPVHLVHSESYELAAAALARETQLKKWSRAKKEALVAGDLSALHQHANCRNRKSSG
jgi:predicted GIY-YIG superfamily endonuclease